MVFALSRPPTHTTRASLPRQKSMSISGRSTKWFDSTIEIPLWSRWLFECAMSARFCWVRFKWSTGKTEVICMHLCTSKLIIYTPIFFIKFIFVSLSFFCVHKISTLSCFIHIINRCLPDGNWSGPVPQCRNYEEV